MTDPLKAFMQANALTAPAFPPDSRYHGLETAQWIRPDGEPVSYVRRRFIPPPENFAPLSEHPVAAGDRLDNLAAKYPKYFMMAKRVMTLDQVVHFCVVNPLKGKALAWDDQKLTDLTAYIASVKKVEKKQK